MWDDSCLSDPAFAPAHCALTGMPAPSPAVSFPSCSSPLLPRRMESLFHLRSWAFSTQPAVLLKCASVYLGSFYLWPGGKHFKTQQATDFSCWPQQFLGTTSFPWYLQSSNRRGRKLAGFQPGSGFLCTSLQSFQSIATSATGSFKKTKDTLKMLQSLQLYIKEKQTAYRCFGKLRSCSTGSWMRPAVFISAQALLKTVVKSWFFLSFRSRPCSWGGSMLPPAK